MSRSLPVVITALAVLAVLPNIGMGDGATATAGAGGTEAKYIVAFTALESALAHFASADRNRMEFPIFMLSNKEIKKVFALLLLLICLVRMF